MTVIVLYAAVPAARLPLPEQTLRDGVEVLRGESVSLVFEERAARPSGEVDDVVAFGETLQRMAATCPVLPVRYGTVLPDRDELSALLSEHETRWKDRLAVVDRHVEVLVHVRDADAPSPAAGWGRSGSSGREYLLARAAVVRHREELVTTLLSALEPLCREVRLLSGEKGDRDQHRVACLIPADGMGALTKALERWAANAPGRQVRISGPWPPFSFTEEEQ